MMSDSVESNIPTAGPSRLYNQTTTAPIMNGGGGGGGGNSGSIDLTEDSDGEDQPVESPTARAGSSRTNLNSRATPTIGQGGSGSGSGVEFEGGHFGNGTRSGPSSSHSNYDSTHHQHSFAPSHHLSPRRTMHPSPSPSLPAFGQASFGQPSFPSPSMYGPTSSNHFNSPYNQSSTIYSPRNQPQPPPGKQHFQSNGTSNGVGSTSNEAIDLTSTNIPSPPRSNPKAPLFIGAITTEAMMFYPSPLMVIGSDLGGLRERANIVHFKGAEFVKVKLKVSEPSQKVCRLGLTNSTGQRVRSQSRAILGHRQRPISSKSCHPA